MGRETRSSVFEFVPLLGPVPPGHLLSGLRQTGCCVFVGDTDSDACRANAHSAHSAHSSVVRPLLLGVEQIDLGR